MDTYDLVSKHPLLAILRNVPLEKTIDYAEAAVQGGAPFFEVALNSPHALEQITMLRTHFGDRCTVGAGTAITVERCKAALDAGAQFLLTPGTPLDVFSYCAENDIALLPGVLTPTDVATSLQFGYKTFWLLVQNHSLPSSSPANMKGRHLALPSRPTVARYCTGLAFRNSTTLFRDMVWYLQDYCIGCARHLGVPRLTRP